MDIISIISRLVALLPIASIAAVIISGLTYFGYTFYKKRGGTKTLTIRQFIVNFLLLSWFGAVMVLTTFSRGANFEGWVNFHLFSGYLNAWHQWSLSELQLIIFNMLMFMPLGFLLPLLSKRTQRFKNILTISLSVTVGIEVFQMISRRGIFEFDDIFHNTLGSIAGFFLMTAILETVRSKKLKLASLLKGLAIPLIFTVLFLGAKSFYEMKELGNLTFVPAVRQAMEEVDLELQSELPDTEIQASLYKSKEIRNLEYAKEIASWLATSFSLEQAGPMRVDGLNRIWELEGAAGEYYLTYHLGNGSWFFQKLDYTEYKRSEEELEMHRDFYEELLKSHELLPENADFSTQYGTTLRWDTPTHSDITKGTNDFFEGIIMTIPSLEAEEPESITYMMLENTYVREVNLISPKAAFEEIKSGNFSMYNNLEAGDHLLIDDYYLVYVYDTKGFYQPVYQFRGYLNGEHWEAEVPAVSE